MPVEGLALSKSKCQKKKHRQMQLRKEKVLLINKQAPEVSPARIDHCQSKCRWKRNIVSGMEPQTRMISSTLSKLLDSEMRLVNHLEIMLKALKYLSPHAIQTPWSLSGRLKATKLYLMPTQKTRRRCRLSKILKSGTNLTRIKNRVLPSLERNLCTSHSI